MRSVLGVAAMVCAWMLVSQSWSNSRTEDPLGVAISPQTLILSLDQGGAVTVHTAIRFSAVNAATVTLEGVPADSAWADSRGSLVARFSEAEVEALVTPPSATLTLEGLMKDGTAFAGSDTVRVIE